MNSAIARSPLSLRAILLGPIRFFTNNTNKGPFLLLHLGVLTAIFVPFTWTSIGLCFGFYFLRMFGLTAGYHRYFSHRSYKTSRWFQFIMACLGCSCMQKGPLWWSSQHRKHHKYSDQDADPHSPVRHGVWWSHVGWVLSTRSKELDRNEVKDWIKFPELRLLEKLHWFPGLLLAVACYWIDGWSGVVWGFIIGTVLLYHGTFLVNSVCHVFGTRRFKTTDASRNNALVAIVTLGEGWHNNHHHYMSSANQGFRWWEIDISYYILWLFRRVWLVWDLRLPPAKKLIPTAG